MSKHINILITIGTSESSFTIYYDVINGSNIATAYDSLGNPLQAKNLTFDELTTGVGVTISVPTTAYRIIIYDENDDSCEPIERFIDDEPIFVPPINKHTMAIQYLQFNSTYAEYSEPNSGYFEAHPDRVKFDDETIGVWYFDFGDGRPIITPPNVEDDYFGGFLIYTKIGENKYETDGAYLAELISTSFDFEETIWKLHIVDLQDVGYELNLTEYTNLSDLYLEKGRNSVITLPTSTPTEYDNIVWSFIDQKNITELDFSNTTFNDDGYCNLTIKDCESLLNITGPASNKFSNLIIGNNEELTTIDFGDVTMSGETITLHINNNPDLTNVELPSISDPVFRFGFFNNPSHGSISLSGFTNMTDIDGLDNNPVLILLHNNNWSESIVDQTLVELDSISSGGYDNRKIRIDGTNSSPSSVGLTAKTSLEGKGFVVLVT